jgi:tetratricopeptide (TPR) repeat protein
MLGSIWQYLKDPGTRTGDPMCRRSFRLSLILFSFFALGAMAQTNPGAVVPSGQIDDRGRLEAEIARLREALKQNTRERVPLDWAMTQGNLGNALLRLGERESGTTRLTEAVSAYREALQEFTRARMPLQWAQTQMNLGVALATLGERESGTARLAEAVAAYRDALQERTRARAPLEWAMTQMNLGVALWGLAQENLALVHIALFSKDLQPRHLDVALEAVDGALEEYRTANAAFYIEKVEPLRQALRAAKGKL